MDLDNFTIKQAHQGLVDKRFSAVELCNALLEEIEEKDKDIKAFLALMPDLALSTARAADERIASNKGISVLTGIPFVVKDNILVKGKQCTAGSKILKNYIAPYDATVIKKLKATGAVVLGKTNLDEFGMGGSTENSAFSPTHNPNDLGRVPGGSSGGSAAAIAANLAIFALGSDTGGSIRQPASFCGVVGLKPTYGAVSRYGLIALASSLDQIGPITKTVEDVEIIFDAIKGRDSKDSTSVQSEFPISNFQISNLKIGVPKEYFVEGIDKEVGKTIREAIKKFENAGAKILEISLPHTEYAIACYYIILCSEASSNLARYDGIKYGYSVADQRISQERKQSTSDNLLDVYLQSRAEGFGDEVRRRIMLGTYVLSAGYYDAYYLKAQKIKALIKKDFEKAFSQVDLILAPTTPTTAFKIGEKINDPLSMYLADIFTAPINLAGLPALSLPAGRANGLPVGLQIIGKSYQEGLILEAGKFFKSLS